MVVRYLQHLDSLGKGRVNVIFMSCDQERSRKRLHITDDGWEVELFQGRSNINEPDNYCGDTNLVNNDSITMQIHHIRLNNLSVSEEDKGETYAITMHFPEKFEAVYCSSLPKEYEISE